MQNMQFNAWMDERIDGCMVECMNSQMDGWMEMWLVIRLTLDGYVYTFGLESLFKMHLLFYTFLLPLDVAVFVKNLFLFYCQCCSSISEGLVAHCCFSLLILLQNFNIMFCFRSFLYIFLYIFLLYDMFLLMAGDVIVLRCLSF